MKANDLRINNYILDKKSNEHKIVKGISSWGEMAMVGFENEMNLPFKLELSGIPLTEEWLINFGFELLRQQGGTQGVFSNGVIELTLSNSGNIYYGIKILPYVHVLQNLYYALKDEELTIKLNN
jgi:hypothetical protein